MSALSKFNLMNPRECMGSIWAAGSLAPAATAYVFGLDIYPNGEKQMMMTDLGNKLWSLFIISIIMNFYFGERKTSIIRLITKIFKMPIIQSFLVSILFILLKINVEKDL